MTKVAHPLQLILQEASKQHTTQEVTKRRQRGEQATDAIVILADVSASMTELAGSRPKIEMLREALTAIYPQLHQAHLIAFATTAIEIVHPYALPTPSGGTALAQAILMGAAWKPRYTLVISDGRPDDEHAAFVAADHLSGVLDVIYCGPESDMQGQQFLRRLARTLGGQYVETQVLLPALQRLLLEGPCATP